MGSFLIVPIGTYAASTNFHQPRDTTVASDGGTREIPSIVNEVLRSPGQPLDPHTRQFMELRFGHNFRHVRVRTDSKAAESARAIGALAYTVGRDVVFNANRYRPDTLAGRHLLAHELAHVLQQGDVRGEPPYKLGSPNDTSEREADRIAATVVAGQRTPSRVTRTEPILRRAKGDMVAYTGGPSGNLHVIEHDRLIFSTRAVSGHPGSKEFEKGVGPIPTGLYALHPQETRAPVTTLQSGVCGASAISSGIQDLISTEQSPCADPTNHFCTVACPTAADPGQMCFTPKDCWGAKRLKIEGSAKVPLPGGGAVTRSGFYIHGGNHSVAVTSGCVKVFDDTAFTNMGKLKGNVPMCVGAKCPSSVNTAVTKASVEAIAPAVEAVESAIESIWDAIF